MGAGLHRCACSRTTRMARPTATLRRTPPLRARAPTRPPRRRVSTPSECTHTRACTHTHTHTHTRARARACTHKHARARAHARIPGCPALWPDAAALLIGTFAADRRCCRRALRLTISLDRLRPPMRPPTTRHTSHICKRTGLTRSLLPHLHQDCARRCHIRTRTGPTPPTSARGLGSPLSHLHRDWTHCRICTKSELALPRRHEDSARPCRTCTCSRHARLV